MWKKIFRLGDNLEPPALPIIKTVGGQVEAIILKGRLEAEDIPVHLSYESASSIYGFSSTGLGKVDIMVPRDFESAARIILGQEERGNSPTPEGSSPPGGTGNEAA